MMYGEAIRSISKRIAAVLNSLRNNISGEVGHRIIKWTLIEEPRLIDNPGGRVAGMRTGEINCLAKAVAIFFLRVRDLDEKVMGWLVAVLARLSMKNLIIPRKRDRLHLWEHDSTVWVNSCLLEQWLICTLS